MKKAKIKVFAERLSSELTKARAAKLKKDMALKRKHSNQISAIFTEEFGDKELSKHFKATSLNKFLTLLSIEDVLDAMYKACERMDSPEDAVKYFCGICWNEIKGTEIA